MAVEGGRKAVVTGGGIGIGAAICLALAEMGIDVAFTYHRHPGAEVASRLRELGRLIASESMDASDPVDVERAIGRIADHADGRLHILVNNAGGLVSRTPLETIELERWSEIVELNLSSALYCTRAALPFMSDAWGRIVNVSSQAAYDGGGPGAGAYAAAKAGLLGLTRALAKEVAVRGITVNAVAPGLIVDTPFHETFSTPERIEAAIGQIPIRRAGRPDDVAGIVAMLASDAAGFVTGEVVHVNGGFFFG